MRELPLEIMNHLNNSPAISIRPMLWVKAKNSAGEPEEIGFWAGDDHQQFVIDGQTRTYYGSGSFVDYGNITLEAGLNIRRHSVKLSPLTPEFIAVLRQYNPKFAPVEAHIAFYNPETNNLIAPPVRVNKGWIDKFPVRRAMLGQASEAAIETVGHTRLLTRRPGIKRSDESQRQRSTTDTFFADVAITGQTQTPWGSKGVTTGGNSVSKMTVRQQLGGR